MSATATPSRSDFFWSLTPEWIKHESFDDLEAARRSVLNYVETFCNLVRLRQTLGCKSPHQFDAEHAAAIAACVNADEVQKYWATAAYSSGYVQALNSFTICYEGTRGVDR